MTAVAGDIFGLGMTLYRLLNGDDLLEASLRPGHDVHAAIAAGRYPDRRSWLPHIPRNVRRVVKNALNVDPASRTATAWDLRKSLEKVLPKVSWEPAPPGTTQWHGVTVDGRRAWRVEIVKRNVTYELRVAAGPKGGQLRKQDDPRSFSSEKEGVVAATRVLDRVASQGR